MADVAGKNSTSGESELVKSTSQSLHVRLTASDLGDAGLGVLFTNAGWQWKRIATSGGGADADNAVTANPAIYGGILVLGAVTAADTIGVYDAGAATAAFQIDHIPSASVVVGAKLLPAGGQGIYCPNGIYVDFGATLDADIVVLYKD